MIAIGAAGGRSRRASGVRREAAAGVSGAVLVVQHLGSHRSELPELLSERGPNPAVHPYSGQPLRHGVIYAAPPDHHLLLHGDSLRLSRGPKEHHSRPAIDPLFRSVATGNSRALRLPGRAQKKRQALRAGALLQKSRPRHRQRPHASNTFLRYAR
ncbi:MAG: chemotaxis protein CheB [Rhodanobacteraceae bacterium]